MVCFTVYFRYKDYVKGGLHLKHLRDPDGGVHLARKKVLLGVMDEVDPPHVTDIFPKDGFHEDLTDLPFVNFGTVWKYMIESSNAKKQLSTAKPLVKGFNFFKSGNVVKVTVCSRENKWYLKSQVLPSMKKSSVYNCFIVLLPNGHVKSAYCGCPAGVDGRCNHIAATLFGIEEYCKQREKQQQEQTSRTSQPCTWNVPRKRKGEVLPISQMKFKKHEHGKEKKDRESEVKRDKDVRAPHQREWSNTRRYNVLTSVLCVQEETGQTIGLSHILPLKTSNNLKEIIGKEHTYCKVDSTVQDRESTDESVHKESAPESLASSQTEVPELNSHPFSMDILQNECQNVKRKLFLNGEEAAEVEKNTRGQSADPLWHDSRNQRITSSKCYRCAVLKDTTSPTKAIQEVLGYKQFAQTKEMKEGLSKEPEIIQEFLNTMNEKGHKRIKVERSGLIVSTLHGFLAASPDGLVKDPSHEPPEGMLEMKYIQMKEDETLTEALLRKRICVYDNEELTVNRCHQYFYQVQHQMYVAGRYWNDFVVKGSLSTELFIKRVQFDPTFWGPVLLKLNQFFEKHMLPELAYPRIKYGLPRLDML